MLSFGNGRLWFPELEVAASPCVHFQKYDPIERDEQRRKAINTLHSTKRTMTMQCLPLYSILKAIGHTEIDFLSLDIEGAEYEVLNASFKAKDFKFKVATVEVTSFGKIFGRTMLELEYLLKRNKYINDRSVGVDTIIRHKTFEPLPQSGNAVNIWVGWKSLPRLCFLLCNQAVILMGVEIYKKGKQLVVNVKAANQIAFFLYLCLLALNKFYRPFYFMYH